MRLFLCLFNFRTNLTVQLANGQTSHSSRYDQVLPKDVSKWKISWRLVDRCQQPIRLHLLNSSCRATMSNNVETNSICPYRVPMAYQLPTDLRSLRSMSRGSANTTAAQQVKVITPFDFPEAEHGRFKHNAVTAF
jgi:hypothetical protein